MYSLEQALNYGYFVFSEEANTDFKFLRPHFFRKLSIRNQKKVCLLCIFIYSILPKAIQKGGLKMKCH